MNHWLLEGGALYLPVITVLALWALLRPHRRLRIAILMTTAWQTALLPWLNLLAQNRGWWSFQTSDLALFGMPLTLYFGWVIVWGMIATLILGKLPCRHPLLWTGLAMAVFDLMAMPQLEPILVLKKSWLLGEAILLLGALAPSFMLAHYTLLDRRPKVRGLLISLAFVTLILGVFPLALEKDVMAALNRISNQYPPIIHWLFFFVIICLAVPGITAVREFATVGRGTPIPYDPPKTLVTSGIYAYLRNPMQFSMVGVLLVWSLYLKSSLTLALALIAMIYSLGLALWSENQDLTRRHGTHWKAYRLKMKPWLCHLTPTHSGEPARIYFDLQCGSCQKIARWFQKQHLTGLLICDANKHPTSHLLQVTYEHPDGTSRQGVEAVSAALSHLHLGMAWLGWLIQIPGILTIAETAFAQKFSTSFHTT